MEKLGVQSFKFDGVLSEVVDHFLEQIVHFIFDRLYVALSQLNHACSSDCLKENEQKQITRCFLVLEAC